MNTPVIDVNQLSTRIAAGEKIVVADCRFDPGAPDAGEAAYQQGHIAGAHYLHLERDLAGPMGDTGGRHPLPSPEHFSALMRRIGVDNDTLLVAYDGGGLALASRLWWLARYFGHEKIAVLDGGLAAWQAAGQPVDTGTAAAGQGNFTARADNTLRVDYEDLRDPDTRPMLIDCRDASRFAGNHEPGGGMSGHIPGAVNVPYQESLDHQGLLRDAGAQRERWSWLDEAGQAPVFYCGSGITACVNLLSLELAGLDGARLYPGSWSDWCQHGGEVATGD